MTFDENTCTPPAAKFGKARVFPYERPRRHSALPTPPSLEDEQQKRKRSPRNLSGEVREIPWVVTASKPMQEKGDSAVTHTVGCEKEATPTTRSFCSQRCFAQHRTLEDTSWSMHVK